MGLREQPWYILKKYDFKGKEHWDPEFKHYDYHNGTRVPIKFRPPVRNQDEINTKGKVLRKNRGKIVTTPIPHDNAEKTSIYD